MMLLPIGAASDEQPDRFASNFSTCTGDCTSASRLWLFVASRRHPPENPRSKGRGSSLLRSRPKVLLQTEALFPVAKFTSGSSATFCAKPVVAADFGDARDAAIEEHRMERAVVRTRCGPIRHRRGHRGVRSFNKMLFTDDRYHTAIMPLRDGVTIGLRVR
jgi:hypothetical protein